MPRTRAGHRTPQAESPAQAHTHARCILWCADIRLGAGGDLRWELVVANPEGAARFFPIEQRKGEDFVQAWLRSRDEADATSCRAWSEECVRAGRPYTQEYRCRRKDGEIRWLREDVDVQALSSDHWTATAVVTDITDRKRAEEARANLLAIFEATTDFVCTTDPEGRLLYANASVRRTLGIPDRSDLSHYSVAHAPWAEEIIRTQGIPTAVERGTWRGEAAMLSADGREIPVSEVISAHRSPDGRLQFVSTIARDITERKRIEDALREAEARFRVIAEAAPIGIFLTDPSGALLYANPETIRQTGSDRSTIAGSGWMNAIHAQDRSAIIREWRAALADARTYEATHRFQRPDGSVIWVRVTAAPVRDGETVVGFVGVSMNVTRRRELEEQLRQAQKMEAVGRLAGGIAHDFNNVLAVINGYSDLLLRSLPPEAPEFVPVQEILKAGERAASLTRQLLAYSRRQMLEPRDLDLNDVVENVSRMLQRLLGEHIELDVLRSDQPVRVFADPGQMEQVLLNLAVNGRDAMPRGGRLSIEVLGVDHGGEGGPGPALQPGRYALLQVSDNGVGIAPDVLPHVFEPFFTTKGVGAGTGLGLATVYGIVRQSGGHIEAESEPDRGAIFRVYLPLVTREASRGSDADEAQDGSGTGSILLVEDDTTVRRLTRTLLEKGGYQVTEAGNGREALAILGCPDARFDAVLTDLVMPEMGGVELAESLRESWPDLPVLFMTGYTEDQIILHGIQDPRSAVLHKPFTADALLHKLAAVLAR